MKKIASACCSLLAGTALLTLAGQSRADEQKDAFFYNRLLGRGINLGNALEAPKEGDWGMTLEADYFQKIKDAGFKSVRIPICWSAHAQPTPPYTIDADFFKRIDWAIEQALSRQLTAIINFHHYEPVYANPEKQLPRFLALWEQVATRYRRHSDRLFFELLNEPHDKLTDERWEGMFPKLLAVVRASNPSRIVIVGPGQWNSLDHLEKLQLPEDDRHLIATFHYYSPFPFTHQGASWVAGSKKWLGTTWSGTAKEQQSLRQGFDKAAAWAKKQRRPIFLGEFGAFSAADMASRARWMNAVAREAEKRGFSWAYWEFGSGFGAYDRQKNAWRQPLLDALVEKK
jgi:endoglucanase